ncbi:UNVERIFIED_CONTAM: protein gamma response 1 [Sesamum calycinum]|uniref:Protein gamma response 1 n=1 Tax=Sesamum calycinum TaxID=2727403 RepID=A0AAW2SZ14_9LAMI
MRNIPRTNFGKSKVVQKKNKRAPKQRRLSVSSQEPARLRRLPSASVSSFLRVSPFSRHWPVLALPASGLRGVLSSNHTPLFSLPQWTNSTILVATIQEAKDRISQIEYIFCSQLFPNFQSLQQIYSEAKEAAEDAYKEKERDLQLQIKRLQCEKQQVLEENQLLKLENAKFISMETQACNSVKELQQELKQKTLEVNEGRKVHENLQKLLESKSSLIHSYETTIKELEGKSIMLQKIPKKLG